MDFYVQTLTELLIQEGLQNRAVSDATLRHLLTGSDQRRHHLVNRALKHGELHRITRGLYVVDKRFRTTPVHPFAIAQAIGPGSYVSAESALSFHGWIPEGVQTTTNVTPRPKRRDVDAGHFGHFSFRPIAVRKGFFLELVSRTQFEAQVAWIAMPSRALLDLAYFHKLDWRGMEWLVGSLRIEREQLSLVDREQIATLRQIYKQRRVRAFIDGLASELEQ